jgi:hypothetical protein
MEIAKQFTDKVASKGPERSAQRNYGMIDLAKGEYVMYVDADMILSSILVDACVVKINDSEADALHVSEIVLGKKYFSRVRRFERGFYDGTPIDGARFFRREAFINVGGFDEELFVKGSGEDWDIDKKIKQESSIEIVPSNFSPSQNVDWSFNDFIKERGVEPDPHYAGIYHNEAEFYLIPYLKKKSYYTQGFGGYIEKWGRDDQDIRCQFGLVYRYWTVFTEKGKWKRLLSNLHLSIGMYLLRIFVGMIYVLNKI